MDIAIDDGMTHPQVALS